MNDKKCSLTAAGLLYLQALYLFVTAIYSGLIYRLTGIFILTIMAAIGISFLVFRGISWVMHIFAGLSFLYIVLFPALDLIPIPWNLTAWILLGCFLLIAYILAEVLFRKKRKPAGNDKFYLVGVILFSILAGTSIQFAFQFTLYTALAALVFLIYLFLHCTISLKPFVAYIAIGINGVLTILSLSLSTFFDIEAMVYLFCGRLAIWLFTLGTYILFDIFSKAGYMTKSTSSQAPSANLSYDAKIKKLEELQALRESGILTEEEFQTQKHKILSGGTFHV